MGEHVLLVVAREGAYGDLAAGALNLVGSDVRHPLRFRPFCLGQCSLLFLCNGSACMALLAT